ncbi:type III pantothenate kinase [mine drainage metagenome]|uniref:Type III pantothenate kinase n=1 Tax=mine drainage metagenome TaxID=410659 RepID=A0A1J5TA28_9ZZZZ
MLLTIDAGNTRTKWAVFSADGVMQNYGACLNNMLTAADLSPSTLGYKRVIISNVAGEQHATLLSEKLSAFAIPVQWLKASSEACDVMNRYVPPESLGCDRWAALISAWHSQLAPCVVVNAGTAVTIDALNVQNPLPHHNHRGEFIGGLILPGLILMQQSLGLATAQLAKASLEASATTKIHSVIFAKNTLEAIQSGALHAIIGAITLMAHELHTLSQQSPAIIISGGNAKAIYDSLVGRVTNQVLIVDNLVLQGLYLLENSRSTYSVQSELQ